MHSVCLIDCWIDRKTTYDIIYYMWSYFGIFSRVKHRPMRCRRVNEEDTQYRTTWDNIDLSQWMSGISSPCHADSWENPRYAEDRRRRRWNWSLWDAWRDRLEVPQELYRTNNGHECISPCPYPCTCPARPGYYGPAGMSIAVFPCIRIIANGCDDSTLDSVHSCYRSSWSTSAADADVL